MKPKLAVTGYRGIWGESLTNEIAIEFAKAFALFTKEETNKENPTILVGRDGRESGSEIRYAIIPELEKLGIAVIDGDILPTPTIIFAVEKHKYDGAIIITASHNPIEYNGLKFVTQYARLTNESEVEKMKKYCVEESERKYSVPGSLAQTGETSRENFQQKIIRADGNTISNELAREHTDNILAHIDVEAIRARKFKVAVDMINASACVVDPYLFEQLGIELIPLNNIPNGKFSHKPEPTIENLVDTAKFVRESGADLGFAHDPDADRLVIINEKGEVISEEYTLGFGVEAILSKYNGETIVINMSTSQMPADIAEKYGGKCFRTKVGEANVMAGIIEHKAIVGGEGTSGVIYPTLNNCRDSFVSLTLALELLAKRNQSVSECVESLPKYFMKRDKVPNSGNIEEMYKKLINKYPLAIVNTLDGLRLDFPDKSWIHLRPSNTEPIIRLFGEAKNPERIEELFSKAKNLIF